MFFLTQEKNTILFSAVFFETLKISIEKNILPILDLNPWRHTNTFVHYSVAKKDLQNHDPTVV